MPGFKIQSQHGWLQPARPGMTVEWGALDSAVTFRSERLARDFSDTLTEPCRVVGANGRPLMWSVPNYIDVPPNYQGGPLHHSGDCWCGKRHPGPTN